MFGIPKYVWWLIFDYIDPKDIVNLAFVCKGFGKESVKYVAALTGERKLLVRDYGRCMLCRPQFDTNYLKKLCHLNLPEVVEKINNPYLDWNAGLLIAATQGNEELMEVLRRHGASDNARALAGACRGGHIKLAEKLLPKVINNCDVTEGLYKAFCSGDRAMVDFMISKVGIHWRSNSKLARAAFESGNWDLIKLVEQTGFIDWVYAMEGAVRSGRRDIVEYVHAKEPNLGFYTYDRCLSNACKKNNQEMIDLMIAKGARQCYNCQFSKHGGKQVDTDMYWEDFSKIRGQADPAYHMW